MESYPEVPLLVREDNIVTALSDETGFPVTLWVDDYEYTVGYGVTRGSSNDLKSGTQDTTTGRPHNNLQPYITAYMWKRTA